jgi:Cu-Zn family superoxide dismutase
MGGNMLKIRTPVAAAVVAAGLALLLPGSTASATTADVLSARATVRNAAGTPLGTVTILSIGGKLIVTGALTGVAAGFHGFHIHSVGICDPLAVDPATGAVSPFFTAGGHLNPGGATHGHHAGDLPSLLVATDGTVASAAQTDAVTLAQIFDADGSAFIIHAGPDNFANIPTRYVSSTTGVPGPDTATLATGDSGSRFACGVITRG